VDFIISARMEFLTMSLLSMTLANHHLSVFKKSQFLSKIVNVLCITTLLLTNITGAVQAMASETESFSMISVLNAVAPINGDVYPKSYKDLDTTQSSINVTPTDGVRADGVQSAIITASIRNIDGSPVTQTQVVINVSGDEVIVQENLLETDANGIATTQIRSTKPGLKSISAGVVTPTGTVSLHSNVFVVFSGAEISGIIFDDKNNNNSLDGSEPRVPGIQVNLINSQNAIIASAPSNQEGLYVFEELQAGNYWISIEPVLTYDTIIASQSVTLNAFEAISGKNIALRGSSVISGQVWNDTNQNKVVDVNESKLSGVLVEGITTDSLRITATSSQTRDYLIKLPSDLPSGPVNFNFDIPGAYLATTTFPQNYNFETGILSPWQSDTGYVVTDNGSKVAYRPTGSASNLTSPVFILPPDVQMLSWKWKNNLWLSANTDFYLLDGETGQVLTTLYTNITTRGSWTQSFANVSSYAGKAVRFQAANEDVGEYIYLDDVKLSVIAPGWKFSGSNISITTGTHDGNMLYRPSGTNSSLTSPVFTVPNNAQNLSWWWQNNQWLTANTDFYLLDGETDQVLATFGTDVTTRGAWTKSNANISAYAGRSVRFQAVNEDTSEYLALDDILITPYATQTFTIKETNLAGYNSSTTDTVTLDLYGGQHLTVNFGDYTLDVTKSTLTVTPDSLTANGTDTAQVVVIIKDALGNPMPGRDVRVESSGQDITIDQPELTTDAQGQVTATLHSTVAQTIEVKARDLAENIILPAAKQITLQPGPVDPQRSIFVVNPQAITANNSMTASVTITLQDAEGNPISGHQVAVQHDGVSVTVEVSGGLTNAQGQTTASLRSSQAQTLSLQVLDQTAGVLLDGTQTLEIVSTDGTLSSIQIFPLTFPAGSSDGATITVTLRDSNGNPVASAPVQLIISGGQNYLDGQETGTLPVAIGTTDENGSVSAQFMSTCAEIKQIHALGQQVFITSTGSVTVTSSTASGAASSMTLSPSEVVADGQKFSLVTVLVKDAYGNPVSGHKIQVNASGLETQVSLPEPPLTDLEGRLTASVTSTQLGTALITVLDETAQLPIADALALTFIPGPADSAQSQVDVQSGSLIANGTSQAMITITLKDSAGHRLAGHEVQLTASGSGNIVRVPAPAQTDINGIIVITVSSTCTGQKTLTIVDRTSGVTLNQKPVLTFIAGPFSAQQSRIETDSPEAPADGQTPANITVTVLDAQNNPVQGASVHLAAGGSAVVSQPVHLTDAAGKTTGQVRDAVLEKVTISATVNGSALQKTVQVTFRGTDLAAELTGTTGAAPEGLARSSVVVKNTGNLPASDVTLTVTLPDELELVDQTAATIPVKVGSQWIWTLGDIAAGKQITFDFNTRVATDVVIGTTLTVHEQVFSASSEADTSNNLASQTITVIPAYNFSAGIAPSQATLHLGGSASYSLQVTNTGQKTDSFHFALVNLDGGWVTLSTDTLALTPGAAGNVVIQVATTTCFNETTLPFEVVVSSDLSLASQTVSTTLLLSAAPQITVNAPAENSLSGSTSVLLSWRTQPETTGTVSFYPAGHPENSHTYTTENDVLHTVQVDDLLRNQAYEWSVTAFSACGSSTIFRHFTVGNGIVFVKRSQSFNIQRDYDQQVKVSVRNDDAIPHTLVASVQSPSDDLIINFVGSGSQDQTITLAAGETRQIALAAHAQDAQAKNYQVTVHLVAEPESSTPISDSAMINLVLPPDSEINYTVEEDVQAFDPLTLGRTYVITNHGSVITDLSLAALTPDGMPANMLVQPSLDHARLESGQSLRVVVYPVYEAADVAPAAAAQSSGLQLNEFSVQGDAPAGESGVAERPFNIVVRGSGKQIQVAGATSCPSGKQVYPVKLANVTCSFNTKDWYCTNRPVVNTPIQIPAFLSLANLASASLQMLFTPHEGVLAHSGAVSINGSQIGSFYNTIPSGVFTLPIAPSQLTSASAGMLTQNVRLNTQHRNEAHYVSSSNYVLNLNVNQGTTYACAASAEEARQAVMKTYSCGSSNIFDPWKDIFNGSTLNWGEMKKLIKNVASELGFQISFANCAQGHCGDPINTRTGAFSFATPDISFSTSAGDLVFHRAYSSGSVDQYNDVLGYGWTHNHDARLLFPADPATITGQVVAGMEEIVIFKDNLGNQSLFGRQADGSFRPAAGIVASLTQTVTDTISYTLTTPDQARFEFDEYGTLLTRINSQGRAFGYTYDDHGKLVRVSADLGTRYIDLGYDEQGRIVSVTDYTGRQVTYAYGAAGDLVSSTDLLGQTWRYTYDSAHHMTQVIDPTGKETVTTEYDMSGRAYLQFDAVGNMLVRLVFNADGSTTVYDSKGEKKTYIYNDHHLNTETRDELDWPITTVYDDYFHPVSVTNAAGHTLNTEWSSNGVNLLATTDTLGNRTEFTYDEFNNLTSIISPDGKVVTYTYDFQTPEGGKLLTSKTDEIGRITTYTYTLEGYLASETDPYGHTTSYTYNDHGQVTSITNWQGKSTTTVYDELGRLIDVIDEQGRTTHTEYNAAGQVLRVVSNYDPDRPQNDANVYNLVTAYGYDIHGNQVAVTDTLGQTILYEYDAADHLVRTIDQAGNITTNTYDEKGQLETTTDALGNTTRYLYDAAGRRLSYIDAMGQLSGETTFNISENIATTTDLLGRSTTHYYDELDRLVKVVDPLGNYTTTSYDDLSNVASSTDILGRVTRYEYDSYGRLLRTIDPLGGITESVYDEAGNRIASIDPLGHRTEYTYDSYDRLVSTRNPMGNQTFSVYDENDHLVIATDTTGRTAHTEYDAWGRRAASVDAEGQRTVYTYDALDRVVSTSGPFGTSTTVFDALGRIVETTDEQGRTSTTTYDVLGQVIFTVDSDGNAATSTYDAVGNLISTTDNLGRTTTYTYDALNRRVTTTDNQGHTSREVYDVLGNVTDEIAANGVVTHYIYDELNRQVAIIQNYRPALLPNADTNVRTDYVYDAAGNRTQIKDANGHVTEFRYDALNRVTMKIDPLGNTWGFTYDLAGNLAARTDANGNMIRFTYDAGGQLTLIDYPDPEADVTFTYNVAGQRTGMTDGLGTTTWTYGTNGRLLSVTDPFNKTVTYTYDTRGNRTGLIYPDGKQAVYTYDADGSLAAVADWNSQTTDYEYDHVGRLLSMLRPNGVETVYTYDEAGRLALIDHSVASSTLSSFAYTYDEAGNITQAVEQVSSGLTAGPDVQLLVTDTSGVPLTGRSIYAFDGTTYTGYSKVTDEQGVATITLPQGSYRFRVDVDGTQFWSGEANHCEMGKCAQVTVTVPQPVLVSVLDTSGTPKEGLSVYAFNGTTYTDYSGATDASGQVSLRLPAGNYRFRADFNGTQFWSSTENNCSVPGCTMASVRVTAPVTVLVKDDQAAPRAGVQVYAFNGTSYTGFYKTTDADGLAIFTLPEGSYRFRADFNGTQFWSGTGNHCDVPGCLGAEVTVMNPLAVSVTDTNNQPQAGVTVYAFNGNTYTGYSLVTDGNGQAFFTLPQGSYRFRADFNGTQFWSGTGNHCDLPGCGGAAITITRALPVTVQDADGQVKAGVRVYAFNGTSYTGYSGTTNASGQVTLTLPAGNYRFRADYSAVSGGGVTQFWSGTANHCAVPGCGSATVTVTHATVVTAADTDGTAKAGLKVYAFNDTTYTGYSGTTDASGQAAFTLPQGSYRFRVDFNGTQFWSGAGSHCDVPGCSSAEVTVSVPLALSIQNVQGGMVSGVKVYAFNGATYTGYSATSDANGQATLTLPLGNYRFRADYNGAQYWSGAQNHCAIPGCASLTLVVGPQMTATPVQTPTALPTETPAPSATPQPTETPVPSETPTSTPEGTETATPVAWYPGSAKVMANIILDSSLKLAAGPDRQSQTGQLILTVMDTDGTAKAGLKVYAFNGNTYTGFSGTTDANGRAMLNLPDGSYRFRADLNGTQFWSDTANHCAVPVCGSTSITVTKPVTVAVRNTDGTAMSGLMVYAFTGSAYANISGTTNEEGQVVMTLPQGSYRFRADFNGTQFWSSTENACDLPGCETVDVTVARPVTVTVAGQTGVPYPNLMVYAFSGSTYTGYSATTNDSGQATLTLPLGSYRFRTDYNGVQFWSGTDACTIPGCEKADVTLPGGTTESSVTISYGYDALNRLVAATYSNGISYQYTYDAVGNRLSYTSTVKDISETTVYTYDAANRLSSVNGVAYSWDANGNLLRDEKNVYEYSRADRLIRLTQGTHVYTFAYDGLGNRLQQTVDGSTEMYVLDSSTGLSQVLMAGDKAYLYGIGRIAQLGTDGAAYFLSDHLNSVRQITDKDGYILMSRSYDPFGNGSELTGDKLSPYGYAGEWADESGAIHLRARYYTPQSGRFLTQDTWEGESSQPMSYNLWLYGYANPIRYTDTGGDRPAEKCDPDDEFCKIQIKNNCWGEPNISNYSEKAPPACIDWHTNSNLQKISVNLAPIINRHKEKIRNQDAAQFLIAYFEQRNICVKLDCSSNDSYVSVNGNYCGHVILSAIFVLMDKNITTDWIIRRRPENLAAHGLFINDVINFVNKYDDLYAKKIIYENQEWAWWDSTNPIISTHLWKLIEQGWMIMPYVQIESGSKRIDEIGGKVGVNGADIDHFVLITGMSVQWDHTHPFSKWNWVRILNPFDNQNEYYWWKDFADAWGASSDNKFDGVQIKISHLRRWDN